MMVLSVVLHTVSFVESPENSAKITAIGADKSVLSSPELSTSTRLQVSSLGRGERIWLSPDFSRPKFNESENTGKACQNDDSIRTIATR